MEHPNTNCDFSNLPLSCAAALGNMNTLAKAVNEIKLSPKPSAVLYETICGSFSAWRASLPARSRGSDPRHFIKSIMKVSFFFGRLKNTNL